MASLCNLRKEVEICSVCMRQFSPGDKSDRIVMDAHPFNMKKIKMCSKLCWWFFQYTFGFLHGFLLSDILQKSCKCQMNVGFRNLCMTDSASEKILKKIDSFSESIEGDSVAIKTEESASDVEDFDCTVRFQNDLQYEDDTGICDEKAGLIGLPRASEEKPNKSPSVSNLKKPVSRKRRLCVQQLDTTNFELSKYTKKKRHSEPTVTVQTGSRRPSLNSGRVRKSALRARRKISDSSNLKETKTTVPAVSEAKPTQITKAFRASAKEEDEIDKITISTAGGKLQKASQIITDKGDGLSHSHSESRLPCQFCSKSFSAKRFLQRHLNRFHPKEISVTCDICARVCKNQKFLNSHMKKEHHLQVLEGKELFHCDQCPKAFNSRRGLALHKEFVHSIENPVNCTLCDLTLKNEIYLKRHMKRSHSDSVICDICGAKFKSRLGLSAHLSAHKGVKSFFCEVCGMGFVRKTSLRRHVQQHNDVDYPCDSCPSSYKTFGSLSLHMLQIHQRGSYFDNRLKSAEKLGYAVDREAVDRHLSRRCVVCGGALEGGVCSAHPTEYALVFKCHRCDLTAEHIDDLLAHLKDHGGGACSAAINVSFTCQVCRKVFPRKLYLNQHVRKHHPGASMSTLTLSTATMSYVCHVCGKHFQQKQYLYVHMKQHLQPRAFACSLCDRKFTYKCNLKNHLTTHGQDKPFQCPVCFKLFRRKEVLNSHRLVHNPSLSPFKCGICGKGLSRKQYLLKHYQVMHPDTKQH